MSNSANHNSLATHAKFVGRFCETPIKQVASDTDVQQLSHGIRHLYVHIPFCARICPYCAFYKDLLDRSQMKRFCEAILRELEELISTHEIFPSTIYFGGGTPTALNIAQLKLLLHEFHGRLDLSQLVEWTLEANPGSVSARKAAVLKKLGVNRISLGVQSWDDELLKLLGREHNARQAEESFWILRAAGFTNLNVDLMFGLSGQTTEQWLSTLKKTIALQPEHISTYCLTYEEDTEFFLRQARDEFCADPDVEVEFFEMTMLILEASGYVHYEISNYARPGFESVHNRAYWSGEHYLGIGPSAFSTVGMRRWQNIPNYREYIERVFSSRPAIGSTENLTEEMKRGEKIALSLRTRNGVSSDLLSTKPSQINEFLALGLLRQSNGNFVLTPKGKPLADSIAEAFL
jgi:putative oxygen-independent coproporphyrinogen III oxidase